MNDLMTKSFFSYVELKKQVQLESKINIDPNTSQFLEQVSAIEVEMEEISNLLFDLRNLSNAAKSNPTIKLLCGLRDRMESDILAVLQKANTVKSKLQSLDQSDQRSRKYVANGLKVRLREIMNEFQSLREEIVTDCENDLKRKDYEEEQREEMVDLQRSMRKLNQVFLDMAVMVEIQGEAMDNIEENVKEGRNCVNGGTNNLYYANQMKKKKSKAWVYSVWAVLLLVFLVCVLSVLVT